MPLRASPGRGRSMTRSRSAAVWRRFRRSRARPLKPLISMILSFSLTAFSGCAAFHSNTEPSQTPSTISSLSCMRCASAMPHRPKPLFGRRFLWSWTLKMPGPCSFGGPFGGSGVVSGWPASSPTADAACGASSLAVPFAASSCAAAGSAVWAFATSVFAFSSCSCTSPCFCSAGSSCHSSAQPSPSSQCSHPSFHSSPHSSSPSPA
mmetsp:Transcript_167025/g.536295  ORF Transcript_167025/g.536295 Transcript_167025/m.536295 type:complete len:207 (-) Transcript_167025:241-861(-)